MARFDIHDNDPGCNSISQVREECLTGFWKSAVSGRRSAVPNPFKETTMVEYVLEKDGVV